MNQKELTQKRLLKRHNRHVLRAKLGAGEVQPDVRTPEQQAAAREASRAPKMRGNTGSPHYTNPSVRNQQKTPTKSGE